MSIEELARTATAELHRSTTAGLDPDDMLRRLHRARIRRAQALVASAAAVVLVVGTAVGLAATGDGSSEARPQPPADRTAPRHCAPRVTCLGGSSVRIEATKPITVRLPKNIDGRPQAYSWGAFLYRTDKERTGLAVLRDAQPVADAPGWQPDPSAGDTAASMAEWLAHRAYLRDGRTTARVVGGVTAWEVTGRIARHATFSTRRQGAPFAPAFEAGGAEDDVVAQTGWADTTIASFTLVDQPGGGVTAIWSFSGGETHPDLAGNQAAVDALVVAAVRD